MISFQENTVDVAGNSFEVEYPIQDVKVVNELVLVLYKPDAFKGGGQFRNLVAFTKQGEKKWLAELPTTNSMDAYYQFISESPLVVNSYCSFRCELDVATGEILNKEFFK